VNVIVDTPIWSAAYRKASADRAEVRTLRAELGELIREDRAMMLGIVRQETLSGIHNELQFFRLRNTLRAFADLPLQPEDYEQAAGFYNACGSKGMQGSHVDFLICAVAARRKFAIFTVDKDFARYAKVLPIRLHQPRS